MAYTPEFVERGSTTAEVISKSFLKYIYEVVPLCSDSRLFIINFMMSNRSFNENGSM